MKYLLFSATLFLFLGSADAAFAQRAGGSPPPPYSTPAKSVADSIGRWERATNVKVDADAGAQIASEATDIDYGKVFIPKERYEQAREWTRDVLVRTYLYALLARDKARVEITRAQVEAYRLAEYLRSRPWLTDPFGEIDFRSTPAGATILGDGKVLGVTAAGFGVTNGPHRYAIDSAKDKLHCERAIDVRPGTTVTMVCPVP